VVLLWGRREAGGEGATFKSADWSAERAARVETAVVEWTHAVAERPLLEGRPFRQLFDWEGLPLWPLVQRFFLSPGSVAAGCVRLVEAFTLVFETELPDEVEAVGLREDEVRLLERCATAKGVLFQGEAQRRPRRASSVTRAWDAVSVGDRMRALRSALSPQRSKGGTGTIVFVRPEDPATETASTLGRLLRVAREEMGLLVTVVGGEDGLEPESLLDDEARRAARAAEEAFSKALGVLQKAPATVAAFRHDDVGFADLAAAPDLEALLAGLLPHAVRRGEGLRALLRSKAPRALCAASDDAMALHAGGLAGVPVVAFADAKDGPRVLHALEAAARGAGMVG
jgi:hypothetical protein